MLEIDDPDEGDFIRERIHSGIHAAEGMILDHATYSVVVDAYPETPCCEGHVRIGVHIYGGETREHTVMMDDSISLEAVPVSLLPSDLFCGLLQGWIGEDPDPGGYINRVLGLMIGPFMKLQVTGVKDESGTDKVRFDLLPLGENRKYSTTVELVTLKGLYELD